MNEPGKKKSILEEAGELVAGPREDDYGPPIDDWKRTAAIWSAILGITITAEQACMCMVGVKISRQVNKPSRDNLVDAAGYLLCIEMIEEVVRNERLSKSV
ncbi:hypothetical protein LCGC14_0249190 [marine sediment metagenome]|uniref:DUF6378 domain-containing protein n=1 Tax=marine sediment metagenome TaxID=412755 RepID=A0A0F9WQ96_9ZZZZ